MMKMMRTDGGASALVIIEGDESMKRFKELVQRATNLWPDAHPEVKAFADMVTEGVVRQNYREQEYYKLTSEERKTGNVPSI